MHAFDLGPCESIAQYTWKLLEPSSGKLKHGMTGVGAIKLLNSRIAYFTSYRLDDRGYVYLPTFHSGVESLAFLRAQDHRFLFVMFMYAVGDGLDFFDPSFAKVYVDIIVKTWKIGHILYDQSMGWTDERKAAYNKEVHDYGAAYFKAFSSVASCQQPKLHGMSHWMWHVGRHASPQNITAQQAERSHKWTVKDAWERTTKSKSESNKGDMLKRNAYRMMMEESMAYENMCSEVISVGPNVAIDSNGRSFSLGGYVGSAQIYAKHKGARGGYAKWSWIDDEDCGALLDLNEIPPFPVFDETVRLESTTLSTWPANKMASEIEDAMHEKGWWVGLFVPFKQGSMPNMEFYSSICVDDVHTYYCDPYSSGSSSSTEFSRFDYVRVFSGDEEELYAQLCALLHTSVGDFAVVRWCEVIEHHRHALPGTYLKFEKKHKNNAKSRELKYDVIEVKDILPIGKHRHCPIITPDFSVFDKLSSSQASLEMRFFDVQFFGCK
jgi:hypothetical protein